MGSYGISVGQEMKQGTGHHAILHNPMSGLTLGLCKSSWVGRDAEARGSEYDSSKETLICSPWPRPTSPTWCLY